MTQLTIPDKLKRITKLTVSDWQSKSDLDSVRNSCDVLYHIWMVDRSHDFTANCDDLLQIKSSRLSCFSWASIFNGTSNFSCGAFIFQLILCVSQCCLTIQQIWPSCIPDLQRCNSLRLTSDQIVFCYSIEKYFIYKVYDLSYDHKGTRGAKLWNICQV